MDSGEQQEVTTDRRGTISDWPGAVVVIGLILVMYGAIWGSGPSLLAWLIVAFGAIAWMLRAGVFTSRR